MQSFTTKKNKYFFFILTLAVTVTMNNKVHAQKTLVSIQGEKIKTTNAQGDNSSNIATMNFVHTAIGSVATASVTGGTLTLTAPESLNSVLTITGNLTGNATITMDASAVRTWIINNQTTGNYTVTIKYPTDSGVTVAQGKSTSVYGDGSKINYVHVNSSTVVADIINDGISTIAPSQNAVFDALFLKAPLDSPIFTGIPTGPTATAGTNSTQLATTAFVTTAVNGIVAGSLQDASETIKGITYLATSLETTDGTINTKAVHPAGLKVELDKKEPKIIAGTTSQYYKGDKTWATLDKVAVGLANVDNTSDLNKPISTATQTALNLKANVDSQVFTGTPSLPSGTIGVTQPVGTSNTTLATTAFVNAATAASQVDQDFIATAGQTTFTLSNTPLSIANLFINGQKISKSAISFSGTTATYDTTKNYGTYVLMAGDVVTIQYFK